MRGYIVVCEKHGDDAVVVYGHDAGTMAICPICDTIEELERSLKEVKDALELYAGE